MEIATIISEATRIDEDPTELLLNWIRDDLTNNKLNAILIQFLNGGVHSAICEDVLSRISSHQALILANEILEAAKTGNTRAAVLALRLSSRAFSSFNEDQKRCCAYLIVESLSQGQDEAALEAAICLSKTDIQQKTRELIAEQQFLQELPSNEPMRQIVQVINIGSSNWDNGRWNASPVRVALAVLACTLLDRDTFLFEALRSSNKLISGFALLSIREVAVPELFAKLTPLVESESPSTLSTAGCVLESINHAAARLFGAILTKREVTLVDQELLAVMKYQSSWSDLLRKRIEFIGEVAQQSRSKSIQEELVEQLKSEYWLLEGCMSLWKRGCHRFLSTSKEDREAVTDGELLSMFDAVSNANGILKLEQVGGVVEDDQRQAQ